MKLMNTANLKKMALLVIMVFVVVSISGCTQKPEEKPVGDESGVVAPEMQIQIIDCGTDLDCFIQASEKCSPAKLLNTNTIDIYDRFFTITQFMELKGIESNKCTYYQRTESTSMGFSDELVQEMLDSGSTQEEIDQEQTELTEEMAQEAVGIAQTCKFNKEDLTAMLVRWKQGEGDSTDVWDVAAECVDETVVSTG